MKLFVPLVTLLLIPAATSRAEPPSAVLDALLGERSTTEIAELIRRAEPAADQAVRVVEIGRDDHTSHHVGALRVGEELHRHDRHDLVVVLLRGHGSMRLGEESRAVGEGSIVYVPRGSVHAFTNAADTPAFAYVLYTPPFDGEDRVSASSD